MKKFHHLAAAAVLALAAGSASAAVIAFDNFNAYTLGGLNGQGAVGNGWAGGWSAATSATVVATATADAPMNGNALRLTNPDNRNAASRALLSTISGNVWMDFLFQFDGGTLNNNDFMALWFGSSAGPNIGLKTNCGDGTGPGVSTPCDLDLFVRLGGTDGRYTTAISIGQTYRIVGHLQQTSGNTYDRFDMWVDPSDTELLGLSGMDASAWSPGGPTGSGSTSLTSFSTIGFRTDGLDGTATNPSTRDRLLIDNLGLYTSAPLLARANDVPEPTTLALVGLALLGAGAARRRRG